MNLVNLFWLVTYYGFAQYLPGSNTFWGRICFSKRIRYTCCKHLFKHIGKDVNIERRAWFGRGGGIEIGDRSGIGYRAHILNNTIIGKDVMMGPGLYMLENTHVHNRTDIPMRDQGMKPTRDQIIIGDDVWIGKDVMIVGSQTIANGSIIAARTLLVKSFPEYSIIGGNPSRLIKSRKDRTEITSSNQ